MLDHLRFSIKMSNIQEEVDCVWNGKFLKDDKHVNDLRAEFLRNLDSDINGIESDINSCTDELERIQIIKKLFQWISLPQVYLERKCVHCAWTFCMLIFRLFSREIFQDLRNR